MTFVVKFRHFYIQKNVFVLFDQSEKIGLVNQLLSS